MTLKEKTYKKYWIPKMHKNPIYAHFIKSSELCLTKQISKSASNVFKMIYSQNWDFQKSQIFIQLDRFWVFQNSDSIIQSLYNINNKDCAKSITTSDFSTLYRNLPHEKWKYKFSSIIDFAFKGGNKNFNRWSTNETTFLSKKTRGSLEYGPVSLKTTVNHLIENYCFKVGRVANATVSWYLSENCSWSTWSKFPSLFKWRGTYFISNFFTQSKSLTFPFNKVL